MVVNIRTDFKRPAVTLTVVLGYGVAAHFLNWFNWPKWLKWNYPGWCFIFSLLPSCRNTDL